MRQQKLSVIEICAGGGGQALGLEKSGFSCDSAFEIDKNACETLRTNRPNWNVVETDIKEVDGKQFKGIDLFVGGVPCPPFSIAGKQLGEDDDRDLFPTALRLIDECKPTAVMLENVRGFSTSRFSDYRLRLFNSLTKMGYDPHWEVLYARDFGVPQLRPRFVLVAIKQKYAANFSFPVPLPENISVGDALHDLMGAEGWKGVKQWRKKANGVAPTLVGGSKKHGGADLGPTRAKGQWLELGVDGRGIANAAPNETHPTDHIPRLTIDMAARIQGFPDSWRFSGLKTSQYRQIGNAFPPPVAEAVGIAIQNALNGKLIPQEQVDQSVTAFAS